MISNLVVKQTYTGNGTARNWPIPFSYTDTSQIKVKLTVNGAETLVPSTDYTVDTVAQNIIYPKTADPIPATTKITLYRETAKTQATDLTNQGALYPETLEASFDKLTEIVQEQAEQIGRAVKTQISSSTSPDELMAELTAGAAAAVAAAGAAATSETNAAGSATAAANSAAAALASQTAAAASQTATATSETNAGASATAAANSAASALASQTAAATSETNAANSAAAALASKTAAATSETNAAASQTAAAGSQLAAANSAAAAQASADTANAYAGAVNCILRGLKISAVNGFSVSVDSGVVLANEVRKAVAAGSVTMSARKAALIYADNTGALGKVDAKYPTDYIDNNTVGMWIFNQPAGANVPNSAFGISSIAVANDMTPVGGITKVDGHADYAAKLDGATGFFKGSNTTNFPSGAAEFEETICLTVNSLLSAQQWFLSFGTASGNQEVGLAIAANTGALMFSTHARAYTSTFNVEAGKTYDLTVKYNGTTLYILVNGAQVFSVAITLATVLTYPLFVGSYIGASVKEPAAITVHYVELRNKMRPDSKTAEISNKLMLPCFYTKTTAAYPTISNADKATAWHEWKCDETSGTAVNDSAGTLNGTATGTTIIDSELGKARRFVATADLISIGSFALSASHVFAFSLTRQSTGLMMLFTNGSHANDIFIEADGQITFYNGTYYHTGVYVASGSKSTIVILRDGANYTIKCGGNTISGTAFAPNTNSLAAYFMYDPNSSAWNNKVGDVLDYALYLPRALSQTEIDKIYNALTATGRRSIIDDVVPTNAVVVAYVKTNSSGITDYNDLWYCYGRREGATGGNRKQLIDWTYVTTSSGTVPFNHSFGTENINYTFFYKKTLDGTTKAKIDWFQNNSGQNFGVIGKADAQKIYANIGGNWIVPDYNSPTGNAETTGYISILAEVTEGV